MRGGGGLGSLRLRLGVDVGGLRGGDLLRLRDGLPGVGVDVDRLRLRGNQGLGGREGRGVARLALRLVGVLDLRL